VFAGGIDGLRFCSGVASRPLNTTEPVMTAAQATALKVTRRTLPISITPKYRRGTATHRSRIGSSLGMSLRCPPSRLLQSWLGYVFPLVLWHCWLGDKNWVLVCSWWRFARLLSPVVTTMHLHHP